MKQDWVTMEHISKECGLSKMTVSRVMTGKGKVSPKTKDLVLRTSKRLNYEPNNLARNFSTNRSGFIGLATPFEGVIGSNYFYEILRGFQLALKGSGYDYALFDSLQESSDDGLKLAKLYQQRKVDGLLVVAPHTNDHFLNSLANLGVPLVIIGESHSCKSICMASCDDVQGINLLCQHLVSLGHQRVAFVGGPSNLSSAKRREQAFRNFFKEKGLAIPANFIQPGDYTMRSGCTAGLALLDSNSPPTAIVAANDLSAYGVIESARKLGLRLPQDLSIVGFDDLPTAAERYPALTTIHQPISEMAEKGAQLLKESLKDGSVPTGHIRMEVSLVVRESTAPPK